MNAALAVVLTAATLSAQSAPSPTFDVVSVKRNRTGDQNSSTRPRPGGGVQITNNTLRQMIRNAYQREDYLIIGGPSWVDSDRFDVVATGVGPDVGFEVLQRRMQAMLSDRFRLAVRDEIRQLPVYELSRRNADRLGAQIRQSQIDCRPTTTAATAKPTPVVPPGAPAGEPPVCGIRRRPGILVAGGAPLDEVLRALSGLIGQTIVDRTGISGPVDVALIWEADLAAGQGVSLFAAVQEQLGLRLEPTRGPVNVLVIDRAELPTENCSVAWRNEATFAAFYNATARAVWAYVYRATGNAADADDIVQDAFCRLAAADVEMLSEEGKRRYVFRIAGNLMTDRWRRATREQSWLDRISGEPPPPPAPEGDTEVAQTFGRLKPRERALLWLAYVEEEDHQSIAASLGVERGSVKVMLSRARTRLRDLLKTRRARGGIIDENRG